MVASPRYIENILRVFAEAAEANRQTPGREGNILLLNPELAGEIMVTGDLHGHRRHFNLICRIAALRENPRRHLLLQEVCHGGPAHPHGGGCMSHALLEDIARLKVEYPQRLHFLLGNHELAELADYPIQKNRQMLNVAFRKGLEQMYGPATETVRQAMLAFLRSCLLAVRLPWGVLISHSLPEHADSREFDTGIFSRPMDLSDPFDSGDVFELLWGRDYRPENAQAFAQLMGAQLLINGHEPCPQGFAVPNPHQIILDCCGTNACYVILPVDQPLSQAEVVDRIRLLA